MPEPQKRFSIALSFPGENRGFVEQVAEALSIEVGRQRVLYDKYYEAEFARPDLDTYLQNLYHNESELVVLFLCADYEDKDWCRLEWRAIRDLIKQRQAHSVMPFRFDTTEIPGLFTTDGYVWIDGRSPQKAAELILQRLKINTSSAENNSIMPNISPSAVHACNADFSPAHRVFNVPFRSKGTQVIGREDALQQVRDELTQGRPTAIGHTAAFEGLGGLGKTQLAVEYAYLFEKDYPSGVIWINADQDINAQLTDIAVSARWIAPETEHKLKFDVALHRLRSFSDGLIVFDNVDDFEAIKPYLPFPTATPHILVTSRISLAGFKPISLNPLDQEQSLQLLFQEAGRKPNGAIEEAAARNIVKQMDGLPLALELAGAYLGHRSIMTFTQYNEKLIADPVNTLCNQRLVSFTGHDADLFKALKVEEDVFEEEPLLLDILNLLTWSGAATMGLSLMSSLIGKTESELSGSLALGVQLKLIQKNADDERYALHRLVREIRRYERPLESQDTWVNSICSQLGDWFEGLRQDFLDLPRFEAEVDHLVVWRDNAEYLAPIHACRLTWLQAYPAYHRGMFQESQRYLLESRKMYENYTLTDSVLFAHILNDLGAILMWLGKHYDARGLVEKALAIRVNTIGEHHPDTVMSYNNLGVICTQLNEHQVALNYLNKASNIATDFLAERYSDIARTYDNIGGVYGALADYKTALIYNKKSLQVCRDFLGEYHPLTASSYASVGVNYGSTGDYAKALEYSQTALAIRCELLGENHPDTASSYSNVSLVYRSLKDYESEREYSEKALIIRKELLGIYHPDTIASYHNVSLSYFKLGRYGEALGFLRKGYEYAKAVLPQGHSLLEQLSRGIREVTTKMSRPGFRSPPIHIKKKKRK